VTSDDFLMDEMTNMAIDFEEERYFKKVLLIKVSKEAASLFNKRLEIEK
jgi:hypothetical protein